MELTKISKNKFGTTYKLKNEINLDFKNIKTLFCIEKIYNYRYIKWNIKNLVVFSMVLICVLLKILYIY